MEKYSGSAKNGWMATTSTKHLGVTPPLNTRPPTNVEKKNNRLYLNLLTAELDLYESPEMDEKRENIVNSLSESNYVTLPFNIKGA
jgi:poly(A) polymerase Pap1